MKKIESRITVDQNVCNGKPIFRNTRITVQTVLEFLAQGDSFEDILKAYPSLNKEDITAALDFASKITNSSFTVKTVA